MTDKITPLPNPQTAQQEPIDITGHTLVPEAELRKLHDRIESLEAALVKCSEQLTRLGYSANHADQALAALSEQEHGIGEKK